MISYGASYLKQMRLLWRHKVQLPPEIYSHWSPRLSRGVSGQSPFRKAPGCLPPAWLYLYPWIMDAFPHHWLGNCSLHLLQLTLPPSLFSVLPAQAYLTVTSQSSYSSHSQQYTEAPYSPSHLAYSEGTCPSLLYSMSPLTSASKGICTLGSLFFFFF